MKSPWHEAIGVLVETARMVKDDAAEWRALDAVADLMTERCRARRELNEEIREAARDARAAASEAYQDGLANGRGDDW